MKRERLVHDGSRTRQSSPLRSRRTAHGSPLRLQRTASSQQSGPSSIAALSPTRPRPATAAPLRAAAAAPQAAAAAPARLRTAPASAPGLVAAEIAQEAALLLPDVSADAEPARPRRSQELTRGDLAAHAAESAQRALEAQVARQLPETALPKTTCDLPPQRRPQQPRPGSLNAPPPMPRASRPGSRAAPPPDATRLQSHACSDIGDEPVSSSAGGAETPVAAAEPESSSAVMPPLAAAAELGSTQPLAAVEPPAVYHPAARGAAVATAVADEPRGARWRRVRRRVQSLLVGGRSRRPAQAVVPQTELRRN